MEDSGAEVDVDFLVGGANVRENHWACLILVVRLRALLQGVKAAFFITSILNSVFVGYPGLSTLTNHQPFFLPKNFHPSLLLLAAMCPRADPPLHVDAASHSLDC